jgi:hypothetical protein
MRTFICTLTVVGLFALATADWLRGQDVVSPNPQNASAANLMHNHQLYPGQTGARRSFFGPAYNGPIYGYGPYYQGYSIPSIQPRRFGSSPATSGGMVPVVGSRAGR